MMKKIFIKSTVLLFSVLLLLTSCQKKEIVEDTSKVSGPVELVVESRLYDPPEEKAFLIEEIFPEFEKSHNCIIRFDTIDDDTLLKKAKFQHESGKVSTDVIIAHDGVMYEWIRNEYIIPLDIEKWGDRNFSRAFRYRISSGGRTYFAPTGGDVYLTLINKKALPYKPEGVDPQNLSWEDYVQWAINVAEGEGEGKAGVTGIPQKSLVYMYGGVFLSYGGRFPIINSLEAIEGWELMVRMKDAYSPRIGEFDNMTAPMKSEDTWMAVAHMVRMGEAYLDNPEKFILAPAPHGSEGIGTIAGISGFAVMNGAPHKALAMEFIKFMTDPERAVRISRGTGGFIPPIDEALNSLGDSAEDEIIAKGIQVLKTGIVSGVPGGDYTSWAEVKQVYDDAFQELVLKRGEVDLAYLDAAQEKLDNLRR